jgi:hypothetical protein
MEAKKEPRASATAAGEDNRRKKSIDVYCDFLLEQENKKRQEYKVLSTKHRATSTPERNPKKSPASSSSAEC